MAKKIKEVTGHVKVGRHKVVTFDYGAGGDVLFLLDGKVCMEITGLAARWDDVVRSNTAGVLRKTARRVVVAIARPEATLLPGDLQLWQDLRDDLLGSDVTLLPVQALPAA